jgi:hypothetical protein
MAKNGKVIQRSEYQRAVERNKENISANPELYKQRQAMVEHPFGTMKRQWGFDHIMTKKTKARDSADVGFIFIAYNLRRIINIIGIKQLIAYIDTLIASFTAILTRNKAPSAVESQFNPLLIRIRKIKLFSGHTYHFQKFGILATCKPGF